MTISDILDCLTKEICTIYEKFIVKIVLYGSVARGTQSEESDIDVALFVSSSIPKEKHSEMTEKLVDLELICGKILSVVQIDLNKYEEWKDILPFYKNIKNEGVVLWAKS